MDCNSLNAISSFLAGLGGLVASVTAIYLARRNDKPRLKISAYVKKPKHDQETDRRVSIIIHLTNVGHITELLEGFYLLTARSGGQIVPIPFEHPNGDSVDSVFSEPLGYGKSFKAKVNVTEFEGSLIKLFPNVNNSRRETKNSIKLYVSVATASGKRYKKKLSREVRRLARDILDSYPV